MLIALVIFVIAADHVFLILKFGFILFQASLLLQARLNRLKLIPVQVSCCRVVCLHSVYD